MIDSLINFISIIRLGPLYKSPKNHSCASLKTLSCKNQEKYSQMPIENDVILGVELMDIASLIPHEEIIFSKKQEKKSKFMESETFLFKTIIVCSKTNVIIDGHHRYNALKELGYTKIPVTRINYFSKKILTNENDSLSKLEIITNAQNNNLYTPKSTNHLIYSKEESKWVSLNTISTPYELTR